MENAVPSNGEQKQEPKFKYFLSVGVTDEGLYAVQTNVPDKIIGYGLCEVAKEGVVNHLIQLNNKKVVQPKGNLIDFLRRK